MAQPPRKEPETRESTARKVFAALLRGHLLRGTRPPGSRHQGRRWTTKEFADECGIAVRTVQNWMKGVALPSDIYQIEMALFGTDQNDQSKQRLDFRAAYAEVGSVAKFGVDRSLTPK